MLNSLAKFRSSIIFVVAFSVLTILFLVWYFFLHNHLYEVVPGQVWRSAQLDADELEVFAGEIGLRSVINLRGEHPDRVWYQEERALTKAMGIKQVDLKLSAYKLPRYDLLQELVYQLNNVETPVLVHCFYGIDRSGLASVVALLLGGDKGLAVIRQEVSILKGVRHTASVGKQFLQQYEEWLDSQHLTHSADIFHRWVVDGYEDSKANLYWALDAINDKNRRVVDGVLPQINSTKLSMNGWVVDLSARLPIEGVEIIWGDTSLGRVVYGAERKGVVELFNNKDYLRSGWTFARDLAVNGCAPVKFRMQRMNGQHELSKDQFILCNETG